MFIRLGLSVVIVSFIAGCVNGMMVDVAPPDCTTNEKSAECYSQPKEPPPMSEDAFFKDAI